MMTIDEAIRNLQYEIDEECHCDYIADEIRLLINTVEDLDFKYRELRAEKKVPITNEIEWISVDDRLPELEDNRMGGRRPTSIRVLCVCHQRSGKIFVKEGYYELFSNRPCWRIPGSIDSVTHWTPLPKPPKMKGGAE